MIFKTTQPLQWLDLVLARAFVVVFLPVVKNKLDQTAYINDRGTCNVSLLFLEHLFIEYRALTNINGSYASTINTSYTYQLAPLLQLLPQLMSYLVVSKSSIESPDFGSNKALRATL